MRVIKFKLHDGNLIWVPISRIVCFDSSVIPGHTNIMVDYGTNVTRTITVEGTPDKIAAKFNKWRI
jgi:hypothetical protein